MHLNEVKIMVKKDFFTCLLRSSYILCELTLGHPKTRLEFIKDATDSLVSDYKETEAVSVARNQGIANLPGKKEKDCIVCSERNNKPLVTKGQGQYVESVIKVSMPSVL